LAHCGNLSARGEFWVICDPASVANPDRDQPMLPNKTRGVRRANDRRVLDGIFLDHNYKDNRDPTMNHIPDALAAQRDDINTIALRFALEPDQTFVAALKEMHQGIVEMYLGEDKDTIAAADAWAKDFLQAAAIKRFEINLSAGVNASRAVH
jgi:hypothetical protein